MTEAGGLRTRREIAGSYASKQASTLFERGTFKRGHRLCDPVAMALGSALQELGRNDE